MEARATLRGHDTARGSGGPPSLWPPGPLRAGLALPDRSDELLTAVGEHLASFPTCGNRDEADDGKGQRKADHHAEDECKHLYSLTPCHSPHQIETHPESES